MEKYHTPTSEIIEINSNTTILQSSDGMEEGGEV